MAKEQRLIDAKTAVLALTGMEIDLTDERIKFIIDNIPTVDAVEVVRCKVCKHCNNFENWNKREYFGCCRIPSEVCEVEPEHFCSYGERREKDAVD